MRFLSGLYNISTLVPGWNVGPAQDYSLVVHNLQTCTHLQRAYLGEERPCKVFCPETQCNNLCEDSYPNGLIWSPWCKLLDSCIFLNTINYN